MIYNPDPSCEKECRFHVQHGGTTAMYFPPVYDKHGNNLNPDRNISTVYVACSVCGRNWAGSTVAGKTDYKESTNDQH